jgi:hypothetical protein
VPSNLEVSLELDLLLRNLDVTLVRLLDEDDLIAVAANDVGSLAVAAILKIKRKITNFKMFLFSFKKF